ncbi:MAG: GNAT family N-acetyltransferase [Sphingobacteriales bacterium]|nr:MAG: GNAT family N-acetyltransferase [Sphingobacteriales bacterium]
MLTSRKAVVNDAAAITDLSHQLGYDISELQTVTNLKYIINSPSDETFVADYDGNIVGWLQVSKLIHLESDMFCEIAGLVVDAEHRSKGIGKHLLQQATKWAQLQNCKRIVVRTNVMRRDTHRFYNNNGFDEKKSRKYL